jgi:glutamyl-tRNA synthetase
MRNYLLRLGWAHGDDEIISTEQAIEWFDLEHIGKSPSRFDFDKLKHVNGIYMKDADSSKLVEIITPMFQKTTDEGLKRVKLGMDGLKGRAKTLSELVDLSSFYIERKPFSNKAINLIEQGTDILSQIIPLIENIEDWTEETIAETLKNFSEKSEIKLGKIAQPLRAALVGDVVSPGIFEVLFILGKKEALIRLKSLQ